MSQCPDGRDGAGARHTGKVLPVAPSGPAPRWSEKANDRLVPLAKVKVK